MPEYIKLFLDSVESILPDSPYYWEYYAFISQSKRELGWSQEEFNIIMTTVRDIYLRRHYGN